MDCTLSFSLFSLYHLFQKFCPVCTTHHAVGGHIIYSTEVKLKTLEKVQSGFLLASSSVCTLSSVCRYKRKDVKHWCNSYSYTLCGTPGNLQLKFVPHLSLQRMYVCLYNKLQWIPYAFILCVYFSIHGKKLLQQRTCEPTKPRSYCSKFYRP